LFLDVEGLCWFLVFCLFAHTHTHTYI
jgi:hypothetical protein